jgi:hypothetical protein
MAITMNNRPATAPQQQYYVPFQNGYSPEYRTEVAPQAPIAQQPIDEPRRVTAGIDQGRYWVGATLTAAVAALAGVIGMVVANSLLHLPMAGPSVGVGTGAHIATYGMIAALIALLAALVYDGMRAFAPRPTLYYTTVAALLTALAVLLPFTAGGAITAAIALGAINLLVGILIMTLVPVAAVNAQHRN